MDTQEQQDWMLMQRVGHGEEAAMAELYDRFGGLVYKTARQTMPSRAEAEDAVQETFIRLWQTADRFDPARAKLVTWVMLITRRHLIDRLRRKGASIALEPANPAYETRIFGPDRVKIQGKLAGLYRRYH